MTGELVWFQEHTRVVSINPETRDLTEYWYDAVTGRHELSNRGPKRIDPATWLGWKKYINTWEPGQVYSTHRIPGPPWQPYCQVGLIEVRR